jgi:hypothetical protein
MTVQTLQRTRAQAERRGTEGAPLSMAAAEYGGVPETGRERQLSIALIRANGLRRLDSFLESARRDALYVFESHPIQSTVRVLFRRYGPRVQISDDAALDLAAGWASRHNPAELTHREAATAWDD